MDDHRDAKGQDAGPSYEALAERLAEAEAERARLEERLHDCERRMRAAEDGHLAQANERLQVELAAAAERKRFTDILDILPAYLVLLSPDYHVPLANRFFRERFGEAHGRRCFEYLFNRAEPCEVCDTYKTLAHNAPLNWQWIGPDGHDYDVFDFPFVDTDGSTLILEMGLDVTERKQAEAELENYRNHLEELVHARTAELQAEIAERKRVEAARERNLASLHLLVRLSQEVMAEPTLDGVLQRTVDAARELLDARLAATGHLYRDGQFHVTATSRATGLAPCPPGDVFAVEKGGVYLDLFETGRPLLLTGEQLPEHPRWWGLPEGHVPLNGLVGAPLIGRDGRVDGLLMVSDKVEGQFAAEDQALLSQLAAMASLAVQHVEAHAEAEAAAARAEHRAAELDAVFNSISSGVIFYAPDSRIARINPAGRAMLGPSGAAGRDLSYAELVRALRVETTDGQPMPFEQLPTVRAFRGETVRGLPMALYAAGPEQPATWVIGSAAPVRAADGSLSGVVSTFSDVTELRHTQERLETANHLLHDQAEELEVQSDELTAQNHELTRLMEALEAERSWLAAILQRMPAGVCIAEAPSGRLTLYNEEMARIWRYSFVSAGEVASWMAGRGLVGGRPLAAGEWPLARALASGETISDQEIEIVRGDGSRGTVSVGATPICDRSGQVTAAVTVIHDVTEDRELGEALGRAHDELAALLAISRDMASTLDLDTLLGIVVDRLMELVPYCGLAVYRATEDGDMVELVTQRGSENMIGLPPLPIHQAAGLKEVMATGRPVLIPDLHARSAAARAWRATRHPVQQRLVGRARCWLGVPLAVKDRVIGVLRLVHDQPGRFTDHDVELATALAGHAALALENARLYEQAREMAAMEERQRLARDLHDAVSQTLFSASLIADVLPVLWDQNPAQIRPRLEELKSLTRGARAEMRTLLWELRPQTLLQARLEQLVQQLGEAVGARAPIQVAVKTEGDGRLLPPDVQVALYRIVQEALNNIVKHARAEHASVVITWHSDGVGGVDLCIEDDGRGFDLKDVPPERLGLKIMTERARAVGAGVGVKSDVGHGTQVRVTWPAPAT